MTVKHLETLQRQQVALAAATDPNVLNKFRAGFTECAGEVSKFPGLDTTVRRRLMSHLASCLGAADTANANGQATQQTVQSTPPTAQLQVHILPQVDATPRIQVQQSNGIFFTSGTNGTTTGLQVVPTRLPNGDIALVLPAGAKPTSIASPSASPSRSSPIPTLIPIPQRTASTASASSSSSSAGSTSTSAASPIAFEASPASYNAVNSHRDVATSPANGYTSDPEFNPRVYSPPLQKPLSLVMRRSVVPAIEAKPWRPW